MRLHSDPGAAINWLSALGVVLTLSKFCFPYWLEEDLKEHLLHGVRKP